MKNFSNAINESVTLPTFVHPQLNKPNDPEGKFWTLINLSNEEYSKPSKKSYNKLTKLAKNLYTEISLIPQDENLTKSMNFLTQAIDCLNASSQDAPDELSLADLKYLKNVIFIVQGIDGRLAKHRWYKESTVDVKAGYVPLKGAAKDPKIKYRVIVKAPKELDDKTVKNINRDVMNMSPLHRSFVAGVEWTNSKDKFSILITNSEDYKI